MYSVSFTQHILECGVIVLGVLEWVSSMESILSLGGMHRFATNLKEVEARQEVREVKDEESGEINAEGEPHTS